MRKQQQHGFFERFQCQSAGDGRKSAQEILQRLAALQIIEQGLDRHPRTPEKRKSGLARDALFNCAAQIFENLLFPPLYFQQNRLGHPGVILRRMNFARFQQDLP